MKGTKIYGGEKSWLSRPNQQTIVKPATVLQSYSTPETMT